MIHECAKELNEVEYRSEGDSRHRQPIASLVSSLWNSWANRRDAGNNRSALPWSHQSVIIQYNTWCNSTIKHGAPLLLQRQLGGGYQSICESRCFQTLQGFNELKEMLFIKSKSAVDGRYCKCIVDHCFNHIKHLKAWVGNIGESARDFMKSFHPALITVLSTATDTGLFSFLCQSIWFIDWI